jgi:hypothetical protein
MIKNIFFYFPLIPLICAEFYLKFFICVYLRNLRETMV